jgi:hypothetical protein
MTGQVERNPAAVFETDRPWNADRPETLVIACSDGRLQVEIDEFLSAYLGIAHYDRFYVPGGAGALASSGLDFIRAYELRTQCRTLAAAHGTRHAILLFHGPSPGGPEDAVCLDYRRKLPGRPADVIRAEQERDARELLEYGMGPGVELSVYRCEVRPDGGVQVVSLHPSEGP